MLKKDLMALLADADDDADINEIILGQEDFAKSSKPDLENLSLEDFKNMLANNKAINGYYQSTLDSKVSKGINTFKEKTLPSLIEEEVKKRTNENKTPEQIKLEELEAKLQAYEQEKKMNEYKGKIGGVLKEKGLPSELIDIINLIEDEDVMNSNIDKLSEVWTSGINSAVDTKLSANNPVPPSTNSDGDGLTGVEREFYANNPSLKM